MENEILEENQENKEKTEIEIARELIENCKWEDAMELLERMEEAEPNNPEVMLEFGRINFEMGDYPTAIGYYEAILENHQSAVIYFNLGMAYEANDEIDRAISAYLKCLTINEKFSFAHKKLGILFLARGDKEDAKEYFRNYLGFDISEDEKEEIEKLIERI